MLSVHLTDWIACGHTQMPHTAEVLILFGHGAKDPEWAGSLIRVRNCLLERYPPSQVRLAFLEYLSPDLEGCVAEAVGGGAKAITILPMFIAQGGHLKREVPELVGKLRLRHPECRMTLAPPVGEAASITLALADHAASFLGA